MTKAKRSVAADVVLLRHHLGALRLPSIKAECEQVARQAAGDNLDYLGFLLRLCERELLDRFRRACSRGLKAARLGQGRSLDAVAFTAEPSHSRARSLGRAR